MPSKAKTSTQIQTVGKRVLMLFAVLAPIITVSAGIRTFCLRSESSGEQKPIKIKQHSTGQNSPIVAGERNVRIGPPSQHTSFRPPIVKVPIGASKGLDAVYDQRTEGDDSPIIISKGDVEIELKPSVAPPTTRSIDRYDESEESEDEKVEDGNVSQKSYGPNSPNVFTIGGSVTIVTTEVVSNAETLERSLAEGRYDTLATEIRDLLAKPSESKSKSISIAKTCMIYIIRAQDRKLAIELSNCESLQVTDDSDDEFRLLHAGVEMIKGSPLAYSLLERLVNSTSKNVAITAKYDLICLESSPTLDRSFLSNQNEELKKLSQDAEQNGLLDIAGYCHSKCGRNLMNWVYQKKQKTSFQLRLRFIKKLEVFPAQLWLESIP
jgi:hypothetical protein